MEIGDYILLLICYFIALIIVLYIAKSIFRIDTIVKQLQYQSAQVAIPRKIVNKIAVQNHMTREDVDAMIEQTKKEVF